MNKLTISGMRQNFSSLWKEINTPSSSKESSYTFLIIALAHIMLGALFSWLGFIFSILYFILKERSDLNKGGSLGDTIYDTLFVSIGVLYSGPMWWPILAFLLATAITLLKKPRG